MPYKIEFIQDAKDDFDNLDNSIKKQVAKKMDNLSKNPFLGEALGNKFGIDLTGFYKLYIVNRKYRIIYKLVGEHVEIIEIFGIGKRDKEAIYKTVLQRLKKERSLNR